MNKYLNHSRQQDMGWKIRKNDMAGVMTEIVMTQTTPLTDNEYCVLISYWRLVG